MGDAGKGSYFGCQPTGRHVLEAHFLPPRGQNPLLGKGTTEILTWLLALGLSEKSAVQGGHTLIRAAW